MKIKKINNDKLKVILSSDDLDEKNVDIDSFLANPIESQNLFFEILDLAEEKYDFEIENNRAIIEAISLDNSIFILTITKLQNEICTYNTGYRVYCFEDVNSLLEFYSLAQKNNVYFNKSNIYQFENKYYFINEEDDKHLEYLLLDFSYPLKNYSLLQDFLIEYGNKIKNN